MLYVQNVKKTKGDIQNILFNLQNKIVANQCTGGSNQVDGAEVLCNEKGTSLCILPTQFQTQLLKSIPSPIAGLKFSALAGL